MLVMVSSSPRLLCLLRVASHCIFDVAELHALLLVLLVVGIHLAGFVLNFFDFVI